MSLLLPYHDLVEFTYYAENGNNKLFQGKRI